MAPRRSRASIFPPPMSPAIPNWRAPLAWIWTQLLIACFFQSVVAAKCYERWEEVMALTAAHVGQRFPGRRVNFFVGVWARHQSAGPPGRPRRHPR